MQQDWYPEDVLLIASQFLRAVLKLIQSLGGLPKPILGTIGLNNEATVFHQGTPMSWQHPADWLDLI